MSIKAVLEDHTTFRSNPRVTETDDRIRVKLVMDVVDWYRLKRYLFLVNELDKKE